ncbi:sensor histidine kinase [Streptomyces sporangiiformans]|uniref:histidine kinase n=1 Tax=Streptomyces sporangiiformans TaxID=2315329 RepID=A0A505D6Q6_9ACTN|nr:HAMP domain-containing sensor histidine kinase [Streptomyces sporangiiformans]TPQ19414.1 HAMP domain-containing histidine kinase [Streptomyces sporangiiformans]
MTTAAQVTERTTTDPATTAELPAVPVRGRLSARVRILLWLLLVTAVAFAAVATTTRSILLRDVDARVAGLLAQETGEFAHFEERGVDPENGRPFTDPRRLLRVFLERQYADPDEELMGLAGRPGADPATIVQDRRIPVGLPLHRDEKALRTIFASPDSTGTLHRSAGEIRWAKVAVARSGAEPEAAFVVAFHPEREQARANEVFRILLAISCVALLMTSGVGWVVAGRILKPVRLVRTAAAQLTEQDLTRRIPVRGRDDVAALAETFNAMLDRLERAFAAQREFVDDAGHELRTPITIVRGHLELMGDDPAEREETVRLVTDELDRMSRIVEDLLLLAKAERPDFVTPEPVQLAELTADVFVKARALGDRHWELTEVADGQAELDPQRITQAMVQLAQNAVQHTVPGQTIRIGSHATGSRVELYVADSGPGVQPQDAEVIFDRFRRGTARRGARGSGAGLGLSIVRAIAEGHRGRVGLRETEGGGATFALALVLAPEEERT